VTSHRPLVTALSVAGTFLFAAGLPSTDALALEIAPGTTSPSLQAEGCEESSGTMIAGFPGVCDAGCDAGCALAENTADAAINVSYFVGTKFVEATAYTDFTVKAADNGEATSLDATIAYDVAWAGGWFLAGLFPGWNDAQSEIVLTVRDLTTGTVVRSAKIHDMDPDGFIGIDIIDAGFGLDRGDAVNTEDIRVIRGHTYRVGLKIRCQSKGLINAEIRLDYKTNEWGVWWNDLKVSVSQDLAEEIEKLKRRVEALENHTHTYLTGRGEGHNNTEAETSKPIVVVEEPSDEERSLLPPEEPGAERLPVTSVFLANAPNPFNPVTTVTYTLPEPFHVTIQLYTAQGRLARTLVDADRPAGPHAFAFDAAGLASGVYYYRLTAGRFTETRKLTLLK
jgi:hypothetical protein